MSARRRHPVDRLAAQAADLSMAVPTVVAHRVARMSQSWPAPTAGDRRELHLMGAEKVAAFWESWNAMIVEGAHANQRLWLAWMRSSWMPWTGSPFTPGAASARVQRATLGILASGLAPVRRRAVGNAKRLGRAKPR
ncbi:MAG TPA: hypothetical protein PK956_00315 [Burkholderiaceae bacterium]|jgi:hypothetical protein|nr:hypothetical protein [Burkholderiaceae bacterium]